MASPDGFSDLYVLNDSNIDAHVLLTSSGVYVLDRSATGGFTTHYVGRSDDDVNGRLKDWVGKYKYFKFQYTSSAKAAFELECNVYHDMSPVDNLAHPARPKGTSYKCPKGYCSVLD